MRIVISAHRFDGCDGEGDRPLTMLDDLELLAAHVASHPTAFVTLLHRHYGPLWRYAMTIVRNPDDADDVLQIATERALRSASAFRGRAPAVASWLFRIVHNCAVDTVKARRVRSETETIPDVPAPQQGLELAMDMKAAIAALPPTLRTAFTLVALEELTQKDAATLLGVPLGTIKTWVWRARARIAESLDESDGEDLDT